MSLLGLKGCFKCGVEKPRSEFYAHARMADGLLGKCKTCACGDARLHRKVASIKVRAYERARNQGPERRQDRRERNEEWRLANPEKRRAHDAVAHALGSGRIAREPCEVCGDATVHAHHDDYARPLAVRWLCPAHHAAHHAARDGAR